MQDWRTTAARDKNNPADFTPDFKSVEEWKTHAAALRCKVLVSQGLWPMPVKTPLNAVIHGEIQRDEYVIRKVYFSSLPGHYVTGNLYLPKQMKDGMPAVLCPYGHWPNGRFIWQNEDKIKEQLDMGAETTHEGAQTPLQARCAMLARMGCIVFMYDMVGFADSKPIPHNGGFEDVEAILRLQSKMGLQTWNSIRAMDFVLSLSNVDPNRVAVTGASSGGTQSILLAAVDERVCAYFPVVMVSMNMQGGCACENAPLLRVDSNNVELASLFAPKRIGMAAAKDWTHDFETRGLPEMKSIWQLFDASENVEGKFFPYPHNYNLHSRTMMYGFMNRVLKLGLAEPVKEKPFTPVTPDQLSVWNEAHPLPADAVDAEHLRKQLTETSDAQLAELRKTPGEYREMLLSALKAMVVDDLPDGRMIEHAQTKVLTITRKGSNEYVQYSVGGSKKEGGVTIIRMSHNREAIPEFLDKRFEVITVKPFAGDGRLDTALPPAEAYAGFFLCHNRSLLANRVRDLLTVIAHVRQQKPDGMIYLHGADNGVAVLLASAIAQDAVHRTAVDLKGFDFSDVQSIDDPMLLPGAVKYGGIEAFASLLNANTTLICNRKGANQEDASKLIAWLTAP